MEIRILYGGSAQESYSHAPARRWKSLTICAFFSIQYQSVTDRLTDGFVMQIRDKN